MKLKLVEWNIHKMTNNIFVKQFVIDTLVNANADVICLVEYLTDTGIENAFKEKYWLEESNTFPGNKVFIAVKKDVARGGITKKNPNEEKESYNFLHIDFQMRNGEDFQMQNGETLSILGVRMLSPMVASIQTPPLKEYLSQLKTRFLCAGDFNIWYRKMDKWFQGISIENIVNSGCSLSNSSIIYVDKNSHKVTGFGAVDHILHSDRIEVRSEYNWDFLSRDLIYPDVNNIVKGTIWNIPPAYPDHALMISEIDINP